MKITLKWLENHASNSEVIKWWNDHKLESIEHIELAEMFMQDDQFVYANWLVVELLSSLWCVKYVLFAAKISYPIYKAYDPRDTVVIAAINATKAYITNPCKEAALAAHAAATEATAYATTYAAASAAYAAGITASAAYAADHAGITAYAIYAADRAAYAADRADIADTYKQIIEYGLKLIEEQDRMQNGDEN